MIIILKYKYKIVKVLENSITVNNRLDDSIRDKLTMKVSSKIEIEL